MLMIGVTPLPALMNRSRAGGGSDRTKSPSIFDSETIVPGLASLTRYGETLPSSTLFGVMLISPSSR